MAKFFPHSSHVREARELFWSEASSEAQAIIAGDALETPRARDWREMIEEYCALLEDLGVPDRDGADVGVIVPVVWERPAWHTIDLSAISGAENSLSRVSPRTRPVRSRTMCSWRMRTLPRTCAMRWFPFC